MSCIFRVEGNSLDIELLLEQCSLDCNRSWKKGFPYSEDTKRIAPHSGAHFDVSDADFEEFELQCKDAVKYLETNIEAISKISSFPGIEKCYLDFGTAITRGNFAVSSYLSPELINTAAKCGVGIEISTYLCDDDE